LTSLGNFLASNGLASQIGWFYAVQGIVSLFMPSLVGIIADRWIPAQRMLSLCHLLAGLFMASAGIYCLGASQIEFTPLFVLYTCSVAFYMPTLGLSNSVAFNALTKSGIDTVTAFPPIRVFGTVGFICAMLFVNFAGPEGARYLSTYLQRFVAAGISFVMTAYALTMPACPTSKGRNDENDMLEALGLRAFKLFKQRKMAMFFIFSMLLGVSLQITNGYANPYITSFKDIPEFASAWAARNANALISLSQISETLCILLIPFFLKRFGIKGVMLMSMIAWVGRFGFFGAGDPELTGGLWMFVLSCIVYGIAFDFFNVSGGLYVDKMTTPDIRSSAQGLFMIMTNGLGATIGTLSAMAVVNHFVDPAASPELQLEGWRTCWYIFAAYAAVVALLFALLFHDSEPRPDSRSIKKAEASPAVADEI
ncbi:MAG: MFS transporter, partial [Paramuribaculum sp.]